MTFVTVGNATQGFRRLLDAVEGLAAKDLRALKPIFIQTGHNVDFRPVHCRSTPFLSMEEFQQWMEQADLLITHGGAGTLLNALRLGKLPVVMPRRYKYGEHVNDHQVQLVEVLAAEGWVVSVHEPEDLEVAIAKARECGGRSGPRQPSRMVTLVGQAIDELIGLK
jgi:UDP-N-acetylglucosamine transferase subunit ALG13